MEFLLVLIITTVLLIALTGLIWFRSRNPAFVVGVFFLYFWTLHGAWRLVPDLEAGQTGDKRYSYLFDRLFPIALDGDYFLSLILYSAFLLLICLTILVFLPRQNRTDNDLSSPIRVSHVPLLVWGGCCLLGSFLIVRDSLAEALVLGLSGYDVTASGATVTPMFLIHQSLKVLAVMPGAVGTALLASGESGLYVRSRRSWPAAVGYAVFVAMLLAFGMLLGNKNELLAGLVAGVVFYTVNAPRPRILMLGVWGTVVFAGIALIDFFRTLAISEIVSGFSLDEAAQSVMEIGSSNEAFAAHFSLYGALHFSVPPTWGSSVLSLLASAVPRMFWPARPETIYVYYRDMVGAVESQGFTIHHATGWYLNFGVLGLLFGAVVFGAVWVFLFRNIGSAGPGRSTWTTLFFLVGFSFFTGGIPALVRVGIEGYKAVVLYSLLFPFLMMRIAAWPIFNKENANSDLAGQSEAP
jgi:hypothetical protein